MAAITDLPVMTRADAVSLGFAGFNDVPHKPIDIADGAFTLTATSSSTIAAARSRSRVAGYHPPLTHSQ